MENYVQLRKSCNLLIFLSLSLIAVTWTPSGNKVRDAARRDVRVLGKLSDLHHSMATSDYEAELAEFRAEIYEDLSARIGPTNTISQRAFDSSHIERLFPESLPEKPLVQELVELIDGEGQPRISSKQKLVEIGEFWKGANEVESVLAIRFGEAGTATITLQVFNTDRGEFYRVPARFRLTKNEVVKQEKLVFVTDDNSVLALKSSNVEPYLTRGFKKLDSSEFGGLQDLRGTTEGKVILSMSLEQASNYLAFSRTPADTFPFFGMTLYRFSVVMGAVFISTLTLFSIAVRLRRASTADAASMAHDSAWLFAYPDESVATAFGFMIIQAIAVQATAVYYLGFTYWTWVALSVLLVLLNSLVGWKCIQAYDHFRDRILQPENDKLE